MVWILGKFPRANEQAQLVDVKNHTCGSVVFPSSLPFHQAIVVHQNISSSLMMET